MNRRRKESLEPQEPLSLRDDESSDHFGARLTKAAAEEMAAWSGAAEMKAYDEESDRAIERQESREVSTPKWASVDKGPDQDGDDRPKYSLPEIAAAKTQHVEERMIAWLDGEVGARRPDAVATPWGNSFEEYEALIKKCLRKEARWYLWYLYEHYLGGVRAKYPASDAQRDRFRRLTQKLRNSVSAQGITTKSLTPA